MVSNENAKDADAAMRICECLFAVRCSSEFLEPSRLGVWFWGWEAAGRSPQLKSGSLGSVDDCRLFLSHRVFRLT